METFLIVMVAVVALMSLLLNLAARSKTTSYSYTPVKRRKYHSQDTMGTGNRQPKETKDSSPRNRFPAGTNYALAPKNPDILAAAMFELLSTKLGFDELIAFTELMLNPPMLKKYIDSLKNRPDTLEFAEGIEFLYRSMTVNGFSESQKIGVVEALRRKANNEFKMLKIQKNMDKIF